MVTLTRMCSEINSTAQAARLFPALVAPQTRKAKGKGDLLMNNRKTSSPRAHQFINKDENGSKDDGRRRRFRVFFQLLPKGHSEFHLGPGKPSSNLGPGE